jgi:uncharacterized protein YidB (DUF937 family)
MGLLDNVLGGSGRGRSGGMSPSMMALLSVLAVAGYQHRDKLGDLLGQATQRTGTSGGSTAGGGGLGGLLGSLGGGGGGLGGLLGGGGGGGGMAGGGLGGLAGALGGGGLAGGLGGLVDSFRQSGQEETARSWVEHGPNRPVAPNEIEQAIGVEAINNLAGQTGLSREELLSRLASVLPQAVDKLTPHGRLPTETETAEWR